MAGVPAPGGLFGRARAETCLVSPETQVVGPVMINHNRTKDPYPAGYGSSPGPCKAVQAPWSMYPGHRTRLWVLPVSLNDGFGVPNLRCGLSAGRRHATPSVCRQTTHIPPDMGRQPNTKTFESVCEQYERHCAPPT